MCHVHPLRQCCMFFWSLIHRVLWATEIWYMVFKLLAQFSVHDTFIDIYRFQRPCAIYDWEINKFKGVGKLVIHYRFSQLKIPFLHKAPGFVLSFFHHLSIEQKPWLFGFHRQIMPPWFLFIFLRAFSLTMGILFLTNQHDTGNVTVTFLQEALRYDRPDGSLGSLVR